MPDYAAAPVDPSEEEWAVTTAPALPPPPELAVAKGVVGLGLLAVVGVLGWLYWDAIAV